VGYNEDKAESAHSSTEAVLAQICFEGINMTEKETKKEQAEPESAVNIQPSGEKPQSKNEEPKAEEKKVPKKESLLAQAKKMAGSKKGGKKPEKKEASKKEVKKGPARVFTVPLKVGNPRTTKTRRAVKQLKSFILKHTKQEPVIDQKLNEYLWERGRKKPPARIRVSVETSEDNKALVSLKK